MTAAERMREALQRCCNESDYCYACDHHPSSGHADGCPVVATAPASAAAELETLRDEKTEAMRKLRLQGWDDYDLAELFRKESSPLLEAELETLRGALRAICQTTDSGPWIVVYREAGGGYEGLQAIAAAALTSHAGAPRPESREGMVTVYDSDGHCVGCMGVETWRSLLDDSDAVSGGSDA